MSQPPLVLVVEDDDSNREMFSQFLESAGFSVLGARNGAEGLQIARAQLPAVIVTDLSMPAIDGWQFARALRDDARTRRIAIVAVSGHPHDEQIERNSRGGRPTINSILPKPCDLDDLLREIRNVMARGGLARVRGKRQLAKAADLDRRAGRLLDKPARAQRRPR
ncbi:MAG TPA: response regulator [Vicinamibacterales bacterium]|nr:response regulator [Vicinamibacterales bacterium]